ncbi:phosphoribosylformylglycinamidine synthase I [Sulfolobus islandicus Y.G.57.14]|jgi:phosphoribosylformylglycinamidine synthase|uniref:Phosphoribosylformylglycinamidine synthase subunit PurQ n=9 Tax=Saccharolobus islandicus TaxID=43080 RepID=M9U759_SACIS|nr:phosphoribosylformylglycinamidine synthase I [Sulfolobus islandicus]ACP35617.1 phosphoribosylformylglycinamidine synthase I [Sulfolobus islandicus L.S.2.15]ACP45770.1 phosphoribosylformylglycinamidine synthase I [Sulfolobus islandicus Y.G.57.14]ACP48423.1 phosphoribosylformylglycinamidine synthase I [Sulfolobus islandicus Y.N.15.51]ACP55500.1 phosphoribosylformylglycinamidine synthase I [Sulfolobus islandicus M.16.27]ACR42102.1 phosphoribosylformylglycinamidine synthase I [Sulfolobus island
MIAIVKFPGTTCEADVYKALMEAGVPTVIVKYKEFDPDKYNGVILPGGFSFGDYLRAGSIAASTETIKKVKQMAEEGKIVIGICNGFQILVESGLLKGALLPNLKLRFISKWVSLKVIRTDTVLTKGLDKKIIRMPIAHAEGRYYVDDVDYAKTNMVLQYCDENGNVSEDTNPNGSLLNIASIANEEGNVIGMMPHPERASFKLTSVDGTVDGLILLRRLGKWA